MKKGDIVIYQPPEQEPRFGIATGEIRYNRIGIEFENSEWRYCHAGYVKLHKSTPTDKP